MRILIVEDNGQLADWLARLLRKTGYTVDCVGDGEDADQVLRGDAYQLAIVDLSLPGIGGIEVIKRLRARGAATPVLVLTANDTVSDRVRGLDAGADDYLAKPFDVAELEARVRAQLRRSGPIRNPVISVGPLAFDTNARQFLLAGEPMQLTPREQSVLEALVRRAGHAIPKPDLVDTVFGLDDEVAPNAIEIYIHRVRKKLEGSRVTIATLRGIGYLLRLEPGGPP
ncbi:MAG: response regulator [Ancalomicrobiaceae bacterium]|nr:response regulator [Ancalomicrobiaceae bacterium]